MYLKKSRNSRAAFLRINRKLSIRHTLRLDANIARGTEMT